MNYVTHLNPTAWLSALVIVTLLVGVSGVQANDGEHGDGEPTPPPPESLTEGDADSPEDFWGPPPGTSATPEPNIDNPSTTISPDDVPSACQSHYENYQNASSGQHILVTLSALEKCIQDDTQRRIRELLADTPCEDIREEYASNMSHWELFAADTVAALIGEQLCSAGGFFAGSGCGVAAAVAVHACLNE